MSSVDTSRYMMPGVVLVLGGILALTMSGLVYHYYYQALVDTTFQQHAARQTSKLEAELHAMIEGLETLQGAYQATGALTRETFRLLSQPLLARHPSLQALAWLPRVPEAQRDAIEAQAQAEGFPDFQIRERSPTGKMVRAAQRPEYFPRYFVEPLAGNAAALGFDLASEPVRLAGLRQARDTGTTTATARLRLMQEQSPQYSVLIFHPLYQRGSVLDTVEDRQRHLTGFFLLSLPVDDMVQHIFRQWGQPGIEYTLSDHTATGAGEVLSSRQNPYASLSRRWSHEITLANRRWQITCWLNTATAPWASPFPLWAWLAGLGGMTCTVLLSTHLWTMGRRTSRLEQMTQDLRVSEARGAAVIASAMDAIVTVDARHRITLFNTAAEQMFGCAATDAIGQPLSRFIQGATQAAHRAYIDTFICMGASTRGLAPTRPLHGVRFNGETFPVEMSMSAVQVEEQHWYTAIIRDVAERQRAQQHLLEQARLAVLESSISDIIAQSHDHTRILQRSAEVMLSHLQVACVRLWLLNEANNVLELQASAGMYREIEDAPLRLPVSRCPLPGGADQQSLLTTAVLMSVRLHDQAWARRQGFPCSAEYPLMASGRVIGSVAIFARQQLSASVGNAVSAIAHSLALGIERLRDRDALRESELRFRQLTEHLNDVFYLADVGSGRLLYISPSYEQIWGRCAQTLYQKATDFLGAVHPEDRAQVRAMLQQRAAGQDTVGEYRILQPNGDVRWILDRAFLFRTSPENGYRVAGIAKDVTEHKRAAAALAQMNEYLEQRVVERTAALRAAHEEAAKATRLKDEFLASMSHELRTPLNAILGLSEALLEEVHGPLTGKQSQLLRHIEESGRHLLALITDILDLAKIEAGKMDLRLTPVHVDTVCQASIRLIRESAQKKRLHLNTTLDPRVATMVADERHLKQMLVNLLSNAVKFTAPEGSIGLEVLGYPDEELVAFTVWDTGIGIAEADRDRLFQPFVQLDSSLARHHAGTGLGLSLVARLARLHEGRVTLESTVGQGSRFRIMLPWRKGAQLSGPPLLPASQRAHTPTHIVPDSGPLILLAEDNAMNVVMLAEYLRLKGYRVAVADTGTEALAQARALRPDLILMDIQMPGMDGLEATRMVRAEPDPALAATPIIALTALAMPGDCARCLGAGANAYLVKPFKLQVLLQAIEAQCKASPTRPDSPDADEHGATLSTR